MVETLGTILSWGAGIYLMVISFLVMRTYFPRFSFWSGRGDQYLVLAIFLGFASTCANTAYWQVLGQPIIAFGWSTVEFQRALGDYLDVLFKGGAGYSGWLHLKAVHRQLDRESQKRWHTIEMPWYPDRRECLIRAMNLVRRKVNADNK